MIDENRFDIVHISSNGREWIVPKDADQTFNAVFQICPSEKLKRGCGFNYKENSIFAGICEYGSEQLISCYGRFDDGQWYSAYDFTQMCKKCPHSRAVEDGFDPYKRSMFDGLYINDLFERYIEDDPEKAKAWVYFVSDGHYIKIGKAKRADIRIKDLQVGNPRKLSILYCIPAKNERCAYEIEKRLHWMYEPYKTYGEWFDILDKIDKKTFKYFSQSWFEELKGE